MKLFTIPKVTVAAWQAAGLEDRPDYTYLASRAHELSISIGEMLGIVGPDTWNELPANVREPLIVFAQRIIEERLGMSEFHDIWCETMLAQGYNLGLVDDDEARTHTMLVPYANLSAEARIMDACFESGVLWLFRERYPQLFDLMPAQNDQWVEYQRSQSNISVAGKGN